MNRPTVIRNARIGLDGRIADVRVEAGRIARIEAHLPGSTSLELDADGRTLLPGLVDAHVHMTQWAQTRQRIDVSSASSAAQVADIMSSSASASAGSTDLLFAYGFRDGLWSERPHKSVLDRRLPGRSIIVLSNDLHAVWLSQTALDTIGRSDHPTGVFREEEARHVQSTLPGYAIDELDRWAIEAVTAASLRGVTRIIDFEVADNVGDWRRRFAQGPLPMRIDCTIYPDHLDAAIAAGLRTGDVVAGTHGRVRVGPVKIIMDGSLNTRTALCRDPYPDEDAGADAHGLRLISEAELHEVMSRSVAHGLVPAVHAIGDEANHVVLQAFERLGCGGRVEHAQLLHDDDVRLFGKLGLVAGIQPAHIRTDRDIAERTWPGRTKRSFRYADLLGAGARLEIGSDAPVTRLDPWDGIAAAVGRDDESRDSWHPEQSISVEEAVVAATGGRDTIGVGEPADLVLVDADPRSVSRETLARMPVSATMVDGCWAHCDASLR